MTCIKISIALTLIRIPLGRFWKPFLYSVIFLQTAYFIGNTVFLFTQCTPIEANWDLTLTDAVCLGPQATFIASSVGSAIQIFTDMLLSLAPLAIVAQLRRPLRERILVCVLMGIGLLASIASIAKAVIVRRWGDPTLDGWALAEQIAILTVVELFLAVLAACGPSLKNPLQRLLKYAGVSITRVSSRISFVQLARTKHRTDDMPNDLAIRNEDAKIDHSSSRSDPHVNTFDKDIESSAASEGRQHVGNA
jgi:hypothetical protein